MPKKWPFVSIIILNYNNEKYLENCLNSLSKIIFPPQKYEVIVVDNASSDNSVNFIMEKFPWVKIVQFFKNYGFAEGNNRAAKYAKGEYLAFLNPDTEVDKDWLIELVKVIEREKSIAACGGKVFFMDNRDTIQNAGHKMTIIGLGHPIGFGERNSHKFNDTRYTLAASGCSMLVRKDVFIEIGGFDPDYFMYVEEIDFSLRLWLYGFKVAYVPKSITYHKLRGSAYGKVMPLHSFLTQKNRLATLVKNFSIKYLLTGFIFSIVYDVYRTKEQIKGGRFDIVKSIFKGDYTFLCELPNLIRKRSVIQKKRVRSDNDLIKLGLFSDPHESYMEFLRLKRKNLRAR